MASTMAPCSRIASRALSTDNENEGAKTCDVIRKSGTKAISDALPAVFITAI
ncbi:hypothetical protein D3C80_1713900 [compost metagenome]